MSEEKTIKLKKNGGDANQPQFTLEDMKKFDDIVKKFVEEDKSVLNLNKTVEDLVATIKDGAQVTDDIRAKLKKEKDLVSMTYGFKTEGIVREFIKDNPSGETISGVLGERCIQISVLTINMICNKFTEAFWERLDPADKIKLDTDIISYEDFRNIISFIINNDFDKTFEGKNNVMKYQYESGLINGATTAVARELADMYSALKVPDSIVKQWSDRIHKEATDVMKGIQDALNAEIQAAQQSTPEPQESETTE